MCKTLNILLSDKDILRFWQKVNITPDCWKWTAFCIKKGYGRITINNKQYYAHRVSWVIHYGQIEEDLFVCHRCDNPKCVNPDHLFLGDGFDNQQDCSKKKRCRLQVNPQLQAGEQNPFHKLQDKDIIEIRNSSLSNNELAKLYNTCYTNILAIKKRKTWTHI